VIIPLGEKGMIRRIVGNKIKILRKARKMTQEELGNLSNLDRTYITSVERGKRNISIVNLDRIASALGVEVKDLFNFDK
jgi:transcriptional regulator with XRE-family HTH domain